MMNMKNKRLSGIKSVQSGQGTELDAQCYLAQVSFNAGKIYEFVIKNQQYIAVLRLV